MKSVTMLHAYLQEFGFLVVTVPEAATLLFAAGAPLPQDESSGFSFQKHLLRVQRELEDAITSLARGTGRRAVVVCDRGLMDGALMLSQPSPRLTPLLPDTHQTRTHTPAKGAEGIGGLGRGTGRRAVVVCDRGLMDGAPNRK